MLNKWLTWDTIRQYLLTIGDIIEKKRPAITGWPDGTLYSSDRPNFIRIRMLDDDSLVEAWNVNIPTVSGLQIYVYDDAQDPTVHRAMYPSVKYPKDFMFSFMKPHGSNHGYYSVDRSMINARLILDLHPSVTGDWKIRVRPGYVRFGDKVYYFAGEDVNLLTSRPASGARYSLVLAGLQDIEGVMTVKMIVVDGSIVDTTSIKAPDNYPTIPEGDYRLICAVKLSSLRAKIVDKESGGDLTDLRLADGGGGSGGGSDSVSLLPNRVIATDSDGLPVNDSPIWGENGQIRWSEETDFVPPASNTFGFILSATAKTPGFQFIKASNTESAGAANFVKYGGTLDEPTAVLAAWRLGSFSFGGHYGSGIDSVKARISAVTTQDWSDPNRGTKLVLSATPSDTNVMEDVVEILGDAVVLNKPATGVTPSDEAVGTEIPTVEWVLANGGSSGTNEYDLSSQIDGITNTFTMPANSYFTDIYWNGQRLVVNQWSYTEPDLVLDFVPSVGDSLIVKVSNDAPQSSPAADITTLIIDAMADNSTTECDQIVESGNYVGLILFSSHNQSGWKTGKSYAVPTGKKLVFIQAVPGETAYDTDWRGVRLYNVTTTTEILSKDKFKNGAFTPWNGDLSTTSAFSSASAGQSVRLEIYNSDSNKRACGAYVIGKLVNA